MILLLTIGLAVVVGYSRGGSFTRLSQVQIRAWTAMCLLFVLQFMIRQLAARSVVLVPRLLVWTWCLDAAILIALAMLNYRIRGMPLVAAGILLNLVVVALNAAMPVGGALASRFGMSPSAPSIDAHGGFYRLVTSDTLLSQLGDVIPVPLPGPFRSLISAGDLVMFAGLALLIVSGMGTRTVRSQSG